MYSALTGIATGGSSVTIDTYELQLYDAALTTWNTVQNTINLSKIQTGLTVGNFYYFKVRAVNKYGAGEYSTVGSVFTA